MRISEPDHVEFRHTKTETMHQSSHPKLLTMKPLEYTLNKIVIVARRKNVVATPWARV
jgi:hypothetical protein